MGDVEEATPERSCPGNLIRRWPHSCIGALNGHADFRREDEFTLAPVWSALVSCTTVVRRFEMSLANKCGS